MVKTHCDNCDAVIVGDASAKRSVSLPPRGDPFDVHLTVRKGEDLAVCRDCLRAAALAFSTSLDAPVPEPK